MSAPAHAAPPAPPGASIEPVRFEALAGWAQDDHAAAYRAFRVTCAAVAEDAPALRPALVAMPELRHICSEALTRPPDLDAASARTFFERHFTPFRILPPQGRGFLTGYFEPEVDGSLTPTPEFSAPVYGRPPELVTLQPGDPRPAPLAPDLAAARRTAAGGLEPFAVRAEIYAGLLQGRGLEQLYLRDEAEVFIIQVQGSARVRLGGNRIVRLTYSGRNGHPYTSIGRLLINEGRIAPEEMSLDRLMGWLRANPGEARRVMEANRSYVFFARQDETDPAQGPIGGAGVPLTSGRSIAIDRGIWPYGLPVFLETDIDTLDSGIGRIARLMVAQDTGSAILGPARADFFWGSGAEAGRRAGLTRHALGFTVLWPRPTGDVR